MYKFVIALLLLSACGQGPQGIPGTVGLPGTNGTTIQPVQFCPNDVPTYPATFPEDGFCIDGSLYAVYSANNGFLTLIPPGQYVSNAIGSTCTFTVLPNCVIN